MFVLVSWVSQLSKSVGYAEESEGNPSNNMATSEDRYMNYSSSNESLNDDPAAYTSTVPSEHENIDYSVPRRKRETNKGVRERREEVDEKQRRRIWSYHCQVADTAEVDKKSKLTEAGKSLSPEEMQLLYEDIFKPLDIYWIISKNCQAAKHWVD